MCTLVLLLRPGHDWPVLIAANRDERLDRPADPPGAWWPEQPDIVGGRDRSGGGTWLAVRGDGMVAAVLNRHGSLGPAAGFASRGELPLLALAQRDAAAAAACCLAIEQAYRGFNLVIADRHAAWYVRGGAGEAGAAVPLAPGLHMVTAFDPDADDSPRTARHLPRFRAAAAPEPPDWAAWQAIIADRAGPRAEQINIPGESGFGTVSSSRVALPRVGRPVYAHADGAPDRAVFVPA